jgi:hypothetical protein
MKVLPLFPGHFSHPEWVALGVWLAIGGILRLLGRPFRDSTESARV